MDSYEECYKRICRVCLSISTGKMVSLTNHNGLSKYGIAIENFANVSIKLHEELPTHICKDCFAMLQQAINFKLICESSDRKLANLYKQHQEAKTNVKELVVDYSLFCNAFPNLTSTSLNEDEAEYKSLKTFKENLSDDEISRHSNGKDQFEEYIPNDETIQLDPGPSKSRNKKKKMGLTSKNYDDVTDYFLDQLEKAILDRNPKFLRKISKAKSCHRISCSAILERNPASNTTGKYVCEVCQRVLANPATYRYHMQQHTGFKYICEHCAKGFPLQSALELHLVTVHKIGDSGDQCPHCPFKTTKPHIMTEHIRLHTGERPYACEKCGLTFRRKAIWVKHKAYHMDKTVQCPHCPRKFYEMNHMKSHINNVHERKYLFMCHVCETTYAKLGTVRKHLRDKHGMPRELQGKIVRIHKGHPNFSEH